jgi:hypothetical protein
LKPGSVALAYIHRTEGAHSFFDCLQGLTLYDLSHDQHLFGVPNPIKVRGGTGELSGPRNKIAQRILDCPEYEWCLVVDDDMGFTADSLDRLLASADKDERPIVGGLCFTNNEIAQDGMGGYRVRPGVTIMDWANNRTPRGFAARCWYEPNTLVRCDGTGSAFLLIHRSVFEKIHAEYGPVWYDRATDDQGLVSEDLSFCMRAQTVGASVWVDTSVRTSHFKHFWLGSEDFWKECVAPPALEQTAVLVPVMRRPQNAEPFMRSLKASTGLAQAYAIVDEDDLETRDAWKQAGAHVIQSSGTSFATKINDGYRATSEPWMFLVGDDVQFHPAWLDHAQYAAGLTGASVIGTNDLGTQRVQLGEHATHMLVRRSYVDSAGFWDGPGQICHEGYSHSFADDELVTAAKQAGVWSMALASKVEHLHPIFGKGEQDAVYELGQSRQEQDRKVFEARAAKFCR